MLDCDALNIEKVELVVDALTLQLCNRPEPKDRTQGLVSLRHWAAVSLTHEAACERSIEPCRQVAEASNADELPAPLERAN